MKGCDHFGSALVGTRPGHPFADLVFSFALSIIMKKVGAALASNGLLPQIVCSDSCAIGDGNFCRQVPGAAVGFVDDLFFSVEIDNDDVVQHGFAFRVDKVQRALEIIARIFGNHGLKLNDKLGKTMIMFNFTTKTRAAKTFLRDLVSVPVEVDGRPTLHIHITNKYKHLGGLVLTNGNMLEEIVVRAGESHTAERALRSKLFA